MRVSRNFEQIYRVENDPWDIKDADSERYDIYRELVLKYATLRGNMLDIGCGLGAFLARFRDEFASLQGVEVSSRAVARGRERFPFISFTCGSAGDLANALPGAGQFDAIIYSDVIYYLPEPDRRRSLRWIADHLAPGGLAFIAAWAPGGRYLELSEISHLVERELAIEYSLVLETGHAVFVCRPRRVLCALTIDYETWQPLPEGMTIDWERDVLWPTERLLDIFDQEGATLTIMAEMGEYFWLVEHDPPIARRMEEQWRDAVRRGHDVQLHLHPNWLPELGARNDGDSWYWDPTYTCAHDYPGDLTALVERCKATLERTIRPVNPSYEVTSFRHGAYEAQPFTRLYQALAATGVRCDSSVLPGDRRPDRHYDYRLAHATHQPYFASRFDPQLKAPPAERALVELPAAIVAPGVRWTFDNDEGPRFAQRLLKARARIVSHRLTSEALRRRRRVRVAVTRTYLRLGRWRGAINRVLPRSLAYRMIACERERTAEHDYYIMVAHSKSDLDFETIASGLRRLRAAGIELRSLSALEGIARTELERPVQALNQTHLMADAEVIAARKLISRIPLDCRRVLALGGTAPSLARQLPRAEITHADLSGGALPFADGAFDCVVADSSLVCVEDVTAALAELRRLLRARGLLMAALPADALDSTRTCRHHVWKTEPHDARMRLEHAGFVAIEIESLDAYRQLGAMPYPPARDTVLLIQARATAATTLTERATELTSWTYAALDPSCAQTSHDPLEILAGGYAWCWGYALVLGEALRREGCDVRWVTMLSDRHPRAVECRRTESHEVLEVEVENGARYVLDPMAGVTFPYSLVDLLADPTLADIERALDDRYRERRYELYATSAWYRDVERVAIRARPDIRPRFKTVERYLGKAQR